jgi:hypothetical protein
MTLNDETNYLIYHYKEKEQVTSRLILPYKGTTVSQKHLVLHPNLRRNKMNRTIKTIGIAAALIVASTVVAHANEPVVVTNASSFEDVWSNKIKTSYTLVDNGFHLEHTTETKNNDKDFQGYSVMATLANVDGVTHYVLMWVCEGNVYTDYWTYNKGDLTNNTMMALLRAELTKAAN